MVKDWCPKCCINEVRGGAKYCGACGTKLIEKPPRRECPRCGEEAGTSDRYCIDCGTPLRR